MAYECQSISLKPTLSCKGRKEIGRDKEGRGDKKKGGKNGERTTKREVDRDK